VADSPLRRSIISSAALYTEAPSAPRILLDDKQVPEVVAELQAVNNELKVSDPKQSEQAATVYIQFQGSTTRERINLLRSSLKAKREHWAVPAAERIEKSFGQSIRYFRPEDEKLAESVKAELIRAAGLHLSQALQSNVQNLRVVYVKRDRVPKGQIEIWIKL
jgi:hypothetical protein